MVTNIRFFPKLYPVLVRLLGPVLWLWLRIRVLQGKENPHRLKERQGHASIPRPQGTLVWIHGASVGEGLSALTLANSLREAHPDHELSFLITSGTTTSADLLNAKLGLQDHHQFYPLDHPAWVARFLDHWRPDAALFVESELWPTMLSAIQARSIPSALVNARLSRRSYDNWLGQEEWARTLLSSFQTIIPQSTQDGERLKKLGSLTVTEPANLKYASAPLPYDQKMFNLWQDSLKDRQVLIYASTHAGEEEVALSIHQALKPDHPNLLSLIIPRHPDRGDSIHKLAEQAPLDSRLLSTQPDIAPTLEDEVVIADVMGWLGLFYRLSPFAFIGKSLFSDQAGGHNPFEAIQCGCLPICGPNMQNFPQMTRDMEDADVLKRVEDAMHLQAVFTVWLEQDNVHSHDARIRQFSAKTDHVMKAILQELAPVMRQAL